MIKNNDENRIMMTQEEKDKIIEKFRREQKEIEEFYKEIIESIKPMKREKKNNPEKYRAVTRNYFKKKLIQEINCCELCRSKDNLDLHHKKYINKRDNVMIVCRLCHSKLHSKEREALKVL